MKLSLFSALTFLAFIGLHASVVAQAKKSDADADSVYFVKTLEELEIVDESAGDVGKRRAWRLHVSGRRGFPYVVLDGAGEVYITAQDDWREREGRLGDVEDAAATVETPAKEGTSEDDSDEAVDRSDQLSSPEGPRIAVQVQERRDVTGTLYVPGDGDKHIVAVKFRLPADDATPKYRDAFLRVKRLYYERLQDSDIAGTAWFRHQVRETTKALGETMEQDRRGRRFFGTWRRSDMESTYALVSGGRAVSENLQLDRELPTTAPGKVAEVDLDEIQGVTVKEFDWGPLLKDARPEIDPLARLIPHDQHAVFFPSFSSLTQFLDIAQQQGTPVLDAAETRSESALSLVRYQRQMCLELGKLDRILGPSLIKSVAVTGGDAYFRTGTDVAVIFEANDPKALVRLFAARAKLAAEGDSGAENVEGEVRGIPYTGAVSPLREISCYVAAIGNAVVVSNSLVQLERIAMADEGDAKTLAELPEYKFFRSRYPRGGDETAFLMLSDATIRRWTGPRWRIACSRRTRAAAVMSEVLAAHLDSVVHDRVKEERVKATHWVPEIDQFTLSPRGVQSSVYGTLSFQTPISELAMEYATQEEAELYRRWREGYERNWSNFFDPIAARFVLKPEKLALDLTVMPLIEGSDYNDWIRISKGASLEQHDGDPHPGALFQMALAINRDSELLKQYNNTASDLLNVNTSPLSWIGDWGTLYFDEDPFWVELAKAEDSDEFMRRNFHRLPMAIEVDSRSSLRLVAFLAGMKSFLEKAAPGMAVWETKEHEGQKYVRISPSEEVKEDTDELKDAALYYAPGSSLIITLNEDVLKRAMGRRQKRREAEKQGEKLPAPDHPWLGENLNVHADQKLLSLLMGAFGEQYQQQMQRRAWGNLPILNEWRRRFPDENPLALHERLWGRRLLSPGGGGYQWDAQWQTMASVDYGHPGEPKDGPGLPPSLEQVSFGNFGLTFEEDGLRTRVDLLRK